MFNGELGIHLNLHKWGVPLAAREIVSVARTIESKLGPLGVGTAWVNDNLGYRSTLVTLAALAAQSRLRLGTAIAVAYARNPVELATSAATLSELTSDREFLLGVGPGSRVLVEDKLRMPSPAKFLGETFQIIRRLLDGQAVDLGGMPTVARYFGMNETWRAKLKFKPVGTTKLYGAVHQGRETLVRKVVSSLCDGAILGRVRSTLTYEELKADSEAMDAIRRRAGVGAPLRKAIQMTTSIGDDGSAARRLLKGNISHFLDRPDAPAKFGFTDEQMSKIRARIEERGEEGLGDLIPDSMVDRFYIAGTPGECVEKVAEFLNLAGRTGFEHVIISGPLGPDVGRSVDIWAKDILPSVT
ncbi:MAG TPA: LLM class flavin-dependent oxidoreductase [Nitrososphaerales archaeon]|nr:LLM class flavin-dependent oxidoreductase [Nitrososphaerales archaeon]